MENKKIQELLEKHIAFDCDQSEQEELAKLIESMSDDDLKAQLFKLYEQYRPTIHISKKEKKRKLKAILNAHEPTREKGRKSIKYYKIAAAVAASVIIVFSLGILTHKPEHRGKDQAMVSKAGIVSPDQATSYIRHLTLADGTNVILKAGSTIGLPQKFEGKTREVTLKGEAYFDVKHIKTQPFIIHTGIVKTTVLGTAFNIKAWPNQKDLIVSVRRGKVRVEDDKKVLAILVRNEQLNYNSDEDQKFVKKVEAEKIITDWTKQDMMFDHVTLGSIAHVLENRYGVNITITNSQLSNSKIVSSFSGTESLENILEVLCEINPNTRFEMKKKEIIISNK
jgi:transmembrane sensor